MKHTTFYLLLFLMLFSFTSCEKLDDLLTFDVKDSTTFTIPSVTGINAPISIPAPTIKSSSTNAFKNNNTNASLVKNVTLKELTLNLESPATRTFNFLKSIEIYISATGEKEVLLASIHDIPSSVGKILNLVPSGNKLDVYIKKESYNIRTVVEVREIPGEDITVKADLVFQVTANTL